MTHTVKHTIGTFLVVNLLNSFFYFLDFLLLTRNFNKLKTIFPRQFIFPGSLPFSRIFNKIIKFQYFPGLENVIFPGFPGAVGTLVVAEEDAMWLGWMEHRHLQPRTTYWSGPPMMSRSQNGLAACWDCYNDMAVSLGHMFLICWIMLLADLKNWSYLQHRLTYVTYLPRVGTAVDTCHLDVPVYSSRNYLNSLEITGKNYYITSCCIGLKSHKINFIDTMEPVFYDHLMNSNDFGRK